jgi:ATP-dependent Lon protease
VREKVLAAQRAGLKRVIVPRENEPDLRELPQETRDQLAFVLVDSIEDVLAHAFSGDALISGRRTPSRERQAAAPAR